MQAVAAAARLLYVIVKQIMQIYCKISSHTTKKKFQYKISLIKSQQKVLHLRHVELYFLVQTQLKKMGTRSIIIVWYEKPPPILNFLHEEFLPSWKFHLSF